MTALRRTVPAAFAAACIVAAPCPAADPNYARNLAATCANCHGTAGRSAGGMPSLLGADKARMLQQLHDFRTGARPATVMHQLAKGYSDEQLELIAGYFAGLKPAQFPAPPPGPSGD